MFKKVRLVMLSSNKKAKIGDMIQCLNPPSSRINWKNVLGTCHMEEDEPSNEWQKVNLYFISDDEIKVGDWCINNNLDTLYQIQSSGDTSDWNKVIATTDESLWSNTGFDSKILPQPSKSFIEKYIDLFNKNLPITEALVEYEAMNITIIDRNHNGFELKVNPKDNTITIKPIKNSWTREEVLVLLEKYQEDLGDSCPGIDHEINKWLEQNL